MAPAKTGSTDNRSNVGAIAGGVVGGVCGLVAVVGGMFFFLWRRRKQQREEKLSSQDEQAGASSGITRNASTMSKAGLIGGVAEKEMPYPPQIVTTFAPHVTRHDGEAMNPRLPLNQRLSQPVMIDSRLDPRAVLTFHGSISRESLASMDDSRDYGRQLNVSWLAFLHLPHANGLLGS